MSIASLLAITSAADISMFEEINYSRSFKEGLLFRPSLTSTSFKFLDVKASRTLIKEAG